MLEISRNYRLVFEGTALYGAEVVIRATSVGTLMKIRGELDIPEFVAIFSEHLVSWELTYDGEPVGIDPESILAKVERAHLSLIAEEWVKAAGGITAPLEPPSSPGELAELEMVAAL